MRYRSAVIRKQERIYLALGLVLTIAVTGASVATGLYKNNRLVIIPKEDIALKETIISAANEGIWLTGDSVILGVEHKLSLQEPIALVNAKVGRQIDDLIKAIKLVAHKNIKQISEWQKKYPDFSDPDSRHNDKYNQIVFNSMSGSTQEEADRNYEKIAKNIIKQVVIEK